MRNLIICIVLLVLSLHSFSLFAQPLEVKRIQILSVNSAITPGTLDYLKRGTEGLPEASLIIIKLNTPGGLVTTTKDIITHLNQLNRPYAIWITPSGASATSAGSIIASSAPFIYMAPGTSMGAATPVGLGSDLKESDGRKKAISDLTSLVRSLSQLRQRPSEAFEKMVTSAESYTDQEAMKLKMIDGVTDDLDELVRSIHGKTFKGQTLELDPSIVPEVIDPSLGQKFLEIIANPGTAYFVFLIGVALLYFEFQAPGGYIAGGIGICFLILAAISFQVLPLDYGSLGLIVLGTFLLILEIFVPSFGLLLISGLVSFTMGSLFLFHGETGLISINHTVILSMMAGVIFSVAILVGYLYLEKKKLVDPRFFSLEGCKGQVLEVAERDYQIRVRGEIWKASSNESLNIHDEVVVSAYDSEKLTLVVRKI